MPTSSEVSSTLLDPKFWAALLFFGATVAQIVFWSIRRVNQFVTWTGLEKKITSVKTENAKGLEDLGHILESNNAFLMGQLNKTVKEAAEERRLVELALKEHAAESRRNMEDFGGKLETIGREVSTLTGEVTILQGLVNRS